jgi:glycerol-3-phosphate dehydrogenase (NAD(P)+)
MNNNNDDLSPLIALNIGIVGLGNLGSAVALLVANNGHRVVAWEYDAAVVSEVNRQHSNSRFLPGAIFPDSVKASSRLQEVFERADLVFVALPSRFIPSVLAECVPWVDPAVPLVNLSKGMDAMTGKTAFQSLQHLFPANPVAMVSGPSLANEFARGVATAVAAAANNPVVLTQIDQALQNPSFAVVHSDDPLGLELGGILKNIYALGLGLFDQYPQYGLNFIGIYLTQALQEISLLGVTLGAKQTSFYQLSGLGDLITTALSEDSHNRKMGRLIAQGKTIDQIREQLGSLPEGYNTLIMVLALARKKSVQLPLANLLFEVIEEGLLVEIFFKRFIISVNNRS